MDILNWIFKENLGLSIMIVIGVVVAINLVFWKTNKKAFDAEKNKRRNR